jgi:16S rRNA (cytidine1402-2'-O)-methyltransferase
MAAELVLVATPLGNLADLTPRALAYLRDADVIYCEDTRHSRTLFSAHDIPTGNRLRSLHEHNERERTAEVIAAVRDGQCVALISDAGTPGISDPGAAVAAAVAAAGLRVTTAPGPSAVIGALSVSGLPMDRFVMDGFVPRKAGERAARFEEWSREPRTIVSYESPQRLGATLAELATREPNRRAAVIRELTKLHEDVWRGTVSELSHRANSQEVRGEIVLVLEGADSLPPASDEQILAALRLALLEGMSVRDAAAHVASGLNVAHRRAYELALTLRT